MSRVPANTQLDCVAYPLKGLWRYGLAELDTNQGAYGPRRFPTAISAQLAAEDDLRRFQCGPAGLGVGRPRLGRFAEHPRACPRLVKRWRERCPRRRRRVRVT